MAFLQIHIWYHHLIYIFPTLDRRNNSGSWAVNQHFKAPLQNRKLLGDAWSLVPTLCSQWVKTGTLEALLKHSHEFCKVSLTNSCHFLVAVNVLALCNPKHLHIHWLKVNLSGLQPHLNLSQPHPGSGTPLGTGQTPATSSLCSYPRYPRPARSGICIYLDLSRRSALSLTKQS